VKFDEKIWNEWIGLSDRFAREDMVDEHGPNKLTLLKWHKDNPRIGIGRSAYCTFTASCRWCPMYKRICNTNGLADQWDQGRNPGYAVKIYDELLKIGMKLK
jgi:hypothetical protein